MDNSYRDRITMLDPSTVKSRVFVKNIGTNVSKIEIEDRFKKHGTIIGIMLQKNYCFVQYEDTESAVDAINKETGTTFQGKVIEVCPARMPLDKVTLAAQKAQQRGGRVRDRSPLREEELDWRDDPRYADYDYRSRAARSAYREEDYYGSHDMHPTHSAMSTPMSVSQDRTNDCEIIVHNKKQRQYAEMIERKLKSYGLTVDLLFPNESIPVTRVLATISSRGTLYAITVSPQNEERNSLTLNILHGSPEEHRNMPLESALKMVLLNYDDYMKKGGSKAGGGQLSNVPGSAVLIATSHPDNVLVMLQLLCQNRALTVLQYDTLLRYLSQRREQQVKLEVGDSQHAPAPPPIPTATSAETNVSSTSGNAAQDQLQRRIMQMLDKTLNRPGSAPTPVPAPVPAPAPMDTSSTGIMQDPKVQKALSSLFHGDLLKNIGKK